MERIYCLWKSGKTDEADALYSKMQNLYPKEFTFFYQHARMLQDLKKFTEAKEKALKAYEYSYGDNRLRVTAVLAEVHLALGEKKEALKVLDASVAQATLPDDTGIRTHRYYDKLKKLQATLRN